MRFYIQSHMTTTYFGEIPEGTGRVKTTGEAAPRKAS